MGRITYSKADKINFCLLFRYNFFSPTDRPAFPECRHGDGQLKIMFIGGPNQRKDYHIEEGEEVGESEWT